MRAMLIAATVLATVPGGLSSQTPLEEVVEQARTAWMAHAARSLVAQSDTVRFRIPGVAVSQALRPGQAARILAGYLEAAEEAELDLREIRHVGEGHAYAEMARRYLVRGTRDERAETVFFGFRVVDGEWRLREVRITP